jgi:Flp pilus assembly protein TadD
MFRRRSQTDFRAKIGTGLTLLQGGDRPGALQLFAEISHSNDPSVLRGLGLAYQQAGETQFAEHVIRRAVAAGSRDALNDLGVLLKRTGRPAEAEQALRQAADAGDPSGLNNLGNLFSERGDQQGAMWFWNKAAEAGNVRAMCSLGLSLAATGHPEARRWYDRAVTKLPEAPEIREQLDALAALVSGQPVGYAAPPAATPPAAAPPMATPPIAAPPAPSSLSDAPTQTTGPVTPGSVPSSPVTPGNATPAPATPSPLAWAPTSPSAPAPPSGPAGPPPPSTPGQYSPAPVAPSPQPPSAFSWDSPRPAQAPTTPPAGISPWAEDSGGGDLGIQTSATVHRPQSNPRLGPVPAGPAAPEPPQPPAPTTPEPPVPTTPAPPQPAVPAQREVDSRAQGNGFPSADLARPALDTTTDPGPVSPPPASWLPAGPPPALPTLEPPTLIARSVLPTPPPGQALAVDVAETLRNADSLREEYLASGNPGTLGQALEASQLAADCVPAGDLATRGLVLGLRCALLRLAYQRDKDQTKLAEAIEAGRAAKSLVRPSDPSFARTLVSLASALQEEYGRTRNPAILTEALALYRDGVHVLPDGHPDIAGLQANICNVLMTQGLQDPRLLTEAVQAGRQAVALTDPDSSAYPARLASLGMALVAHRANNQGPQSELDEAERLFSQALAALPADHALRSQVQGYVDAVAALRQRPQ